MTLAHGFWMGGWPGPFELLAVLAWVGFWVLVVFLIYRLIRRAPGAPSAPSALRTLEERYARGEIDRDEFLERRSVLRGEARPATGGSSTAPPGSGPTTEPPDRRTDEL